MLLADPERAERTRASCARLGIATVGVRGATGEGVDAYEAVVELGTPLPDVDVAPDDDATILYTSGTTGRPKGAVSTHRAIIQALAGFGCRTAVQRARFPDEAKAAAELAAGVHPHRPALPRDRWGRRVPLVRGERVEARDDAEVGPGAGARADRA